MVKPMQSYLPPNAEVCNFLLGKLIATSPGEGNPGGKITTEEEIFGEDLTLEINY